MKDIFIDGPIYNDGGIFGGEQGFITNIVKDLSANKDDDVLVNITSPGGSYFQGLRLMDKFKEHNGKVNMKVSGLAASMGAIFLASADYSEATKYSKIMLHKGYGAEADLLDQINADIAEMMIAKGADEGVINKIFLEKGSGDYWFTAQQAEDLGIIDKALTVDEVGLAANTENLIDDYYSMFGNVENKIIYNNNNEVEMGLFNNEEKVKLEKEISDLTENVKDLTNAKLDLDKTNASLKEDNEKMTNDINEANEAKAKEDKELESKSSDFKAQVDELKKENTELKGSIESNTKDVAALRKEIDDLVATIKKTITDFKVEPAAEIDDEDSMTGFNGKINAINEETK